MSWGLQILDCSVRHHLNFAPQGRKFKVRQAKTLLYAPSILHSLDWFVITRQCQSIIDASNFTESILQIYGSLLFRMMYKEGDIVTRKYRSDSVSVQHSTTSQAWRTLYLHIAA